MKEIKAYIRRSRVKAVVNALQQAGAPGITVVEVHPVGYGYESNYFEPVFTDVMQRYKYLEIVKLEVVSADIDLERLIEVIRAECHTGAQGDGMIFIAGVTDAIHIRSEIRGEQALRVK